MIDFTFDIQRFADLEKTVTLPYTDPETGTTVNRTYKMTLSSDADVTITNIDGVKLGKPTIQEVSKNSKMYRYVASVPRASQYIIKVSSK